MGVWDIYEDRIKNSGETKREAFMQRERRILNTKVKDSLSCQTVTVFTQDNSYNISSEEAQKKSFIQDVLIINSDNLDEKTLITLPGEDMDCGNIIFWDENYWIVEERDANTTIYTKTKLRQCNHLLRWIDPESKQIIEQWCFIEDGTKYLTGELEDRKFIITRGDSRIAMTITRNDMTVKFGRSNRFLIDDPESPQKLAYLLTKPLKLAGVYNGKGYYKFVLQEVTSTQDDNQELGIAEYYKYFPTGEVVTPPETVPGTNKRMWL